MIREFDIYGIICPLTDALVRASYRREDEIKTILARLNEHGLEPKELALCAAFLDGCQHLYDDC